MPGMRLTKQVVESLTPEVRDYFVWDTELKGFGLKVSKGGRKTFVCQYRTGGGRSGESRRMSIGAYSSAFPLDKARTEARKILGKAATGEDPAAEKQELKNRMSVSELCEQYLAYGCGTKKQSTLATDRGRIVRHILPLLGRKTVQDVTRADIKRFLQDVANGKTATDEKTVLRGRAIVRGGKGTATRTVGLLGGIFSYAVDLGIIESNPVQGIKRFADKKGERFLSQQELARLGSAMREAERDGANASALAIVKLLVFTGARKGEIESLKWQDVDFDNSVLRLGDSKTGQKSILLSAGALSVLSEIPHLEGNPYVFPAHRGKRNYVGVPKVWRRIRQLAALPDVRIHDLRHSFASLAVSGGASLPVIGALLGQKNAATTQRYAHLSNDPLRQVNEAVGGRIAAAFDSSSNDGIDPIVTQLVSINGKRK